MESVSQKGLKQPRRISAAVIGGSAGGIKAAMEILSGLPPSFPLPVIVVLHQSHRETVYWVEYLGRHAKLPVVEVEDKMPLSAGTIHCAPAGYHILLEWDRTFALSVDEKVNFSRPSIDVLFSTAAETFGPALVGVVLTGANEDGAGGLAEIAARGGIALVQSPATAEWPFMPQAALQAVPQALAVDLQQIAAKLVELSLQVPD